MMNNENLLELEINNYPSLFIFNIIKQYLKVQKKTEMRTSARCWLCGRTAFNFLPLRDGISKTFCLNESAKSPNSDAICLSCHGMSSKKYFDDYAMARPNMNLKIGYATSWRNYSHVVFKDHHSCPNRSEWGEWLLNPPDPPFLFVMAVSSQKHLIYKSKISTSREIFFIQMEDDLIIVDRSIFRRCFSIIRKLLELGFSKKQILTNQYFYKNVIKYGREDWKKLNDSLTCFRHLNPQLIELGCFIGIKKEKI